MICHQRIRLYEAAALIDVAKNGMIENVEHLTQNGKIDITEIRNMKVQYHSIKYLKDQSIKLHQN